MGDNEANVAPISSSIIAAAANAAAQGAKALAGSKGIPDDIRVSFNRAVGDPGFCIWVENKRDFPLRVVEWGVMIAADAPTPAVGRWTRIVQFEPRGEGGLAPATFASLSAAEYGEVEVPPRTRLRFMVGIDANAYEELRPKLQELYQAADEGLIAWAHVAGVGYVFSARKNSDWARSDLLPTLCVCGCLNVAHQPGAKTKREWPRFWRKRPSHTFGRCHGSRGGQPCGCQAFEFARDGTRRAQDPKQR
jgi:hypothetical protein